MPEVLRDSSNSLPSTLRPISRLLASLHSSTGLFQYGTHTPYPPWGSTHCDSRILRGLTGQYALLLSPKAHLLAGSTRIVDSGHHLCRVRAANAEESQLDIPPFCACGHHTRPATADRRKSYISCKRVRAFTFGVVELIFTDSHS